MIDPAEDAWYFALPETNLPHELMHGELRLPAAPNRRHQEISATIHEAMRNQVRAHGLGRVFNSPVDVVKDRQRPLVLQPDILLVSRERSGDLSDKVYGAPDLVVEIFSPAGDLFDRTEKAAF